PRDLAGQHERVRVEELLRHVLLDRRGLALADPHEHDALERARGVGPGFRARLAAHAGVGALGEHGHVLAAVVEDPAVIGARDGPAIVAVALAQARAAMRADVVEGGDLPGGAAEEAHVLAEERELRRLAPAHLARADRRVPVVPEAQLWDEVT